MAANQTVAQAPGLRKLADPILELKPRHGVVTLYGYGIDVRVDRGHLVIDDGIGTDRSRWRLPRVDHGLRRLVVIGSDGSISLSALRWLADQAASFVMLERDGTVLATTGPVRPSDVRLRRAQALAHQSAAAFRISRELIDRKLAGQERVAREALKDEAAWELIHQIRSELAEVETIDAIRLVESRAAKVYWTAWRAVQLRFPLKDLPRIPEHWRSFGSRASALSGSPRLAVNPVNAILNYLYALLEAECRLAAAALGLDPEMGVLHTDTPNRDSLACDLMEVIRPDVDAYVLDWIGRQPLKRSWFFEERNGNCRLMADLTTQLTATILTWARLVAPLAEWAMREFASTTRTKRVTTPTRLTQNRKRALSGGEYQVKPTASVRQPNMCGVCGKKIGGRHKRCKACEVAPATVRLTEVAAMGRPASRSAIAQAKRSVTRRANHVALREWNPNDQPVWLTEDFYVSKMKPFLAHASSSAIARELEVSRGYATEIRYGRVPHPRHWHALAVLMKYLQAHPTTGCSDQ